METALILLICVYCTGFIVYAFGIKAGYFSIIPNTFLYKLLFCAAWPVVGIMFIWYHIKKLLKEPEVQGGDTTKMPKERNDRKQK